MASAAVENTEPSIPGASNLSAFFDEWAREKSLLLSPKSWRVFVDSFSAELAESTSIEFVCNWSRDWLTDTIVVGELREELDKIPITITVHRANDGIIEALKSDNAGRKASDTDERKRTAFVGLFQYWKPINSGDGVVNDKNGSVSGWLAMGADSFDFLRSIVTQSEPPDFSLGLTVRFPQKEREWDGIEQIDIVSGRFVLPSIPDAATDENPTETLPDPASLQLTASREIAANLERFRLTVICAAAAIALAIVIFH